MARPRKIVAMFAAARRADCRLSTWMRENHDLLVAELGVGRVDWQRVLPVLVALGLTDEAGGAPSRDTASRTWKRVRTAVEAQRRAKVAPAPMLAPSEIAPGVRRVALTPFQQPALDARPVALRGAPLRTASAGLAPAPGMPGPATPAAPEPPEVAEATEQIRAVLRQMGALRVPLPSRSS